MNWIETTGKHVDGLLRMCIAQHGPVTVQPIIMGGRPFGRDYKRPDGSIIAFYRNGGTDYSSTGKGTWLLPVPD